MQVSIEKAKTGKSILLACPHCGCEIQIDNEKNVTAKNIPPVDDSPPEDPTEGDNLPVEDNIPSSSSWIDELFNEE